MPRTNDPTLRALLISETPNAIEVQRIGHAFTWWIPRSQIGYMRKDKSPDGTKTSVTFTLPEWLIGKKECWDLVQS